jgi:DNA polymerase IV
VVLKLKTADFRLLTRSVTPPARPATADELAEIALALRERVGLPMRTRYRLVGVGLSGFVDRDDLASQPELFAP